MRVKRHEDPVLAPDQLRAGALDHCAAAGGTEDMDGADADSVTRVLWRFASLEAIKRLFHAALEYEPSQRPAFLAQACAGDLYLRQEVEALLASHEQAETFIETPASDIAAALVTENRSELVAGQMVGPHRIAGVLATGGMGEVYLLRT